MRRPSESSFVVPSSVDAAVRSAQAHAARAAARLKTQSHCWAALSTGNTRQILDAVKLLRPSALNTIRTFVSTASADDAQVHHQLHELLDTEAEAITSDARQFDRVRDALEKFATTHLHRKVFGFGEDDAEAEADFEADLALARDTLTPERLGVAPAYCDGGAWTAATVMLHRLGRHRAPADKVALLVNTCRLIERRLYLLGTAAATNAAQKKRATREAKEHHRQVLRQYEEEFLARGGAAGSGGEGGSVHDIGRLAMAERADDTGTGSPAAAAAASGAALAAPAAPEPGAARSQAPAAATNEAADEDVHIGADEFFPVLVWVVLQATPPRITSELSYIARFRNPDRLRGVSGCYYTHVRAAVQFVEMAARGPIDMPPSPSAAGSEAAQARGGDLLEPHGDGLGESAAVAPSSAAPSALRVAAGQLAGWLFGETSSAAAAPPSTDQRPIHRADIAQPPLDGYAPATGAGSNWRHSLGEREEEEEEEEASAAQLLGFY